MLKKQPCYAEIINDLNDDIVNLFRVLKNFEAASELTRLISLTPYSRVEFEKAKNSCENNWIERAMNFIIRSQMGFNGASLNTGFRNNSNRKGSIPAHNWRNMEQVISSVANRLQGGDY